MAAYAAAVSLMHIIDTIKNHPSPPISPDKQQFDSLTEVVAFLQKFLESYVSRFSNSDEADPLEMRIAEAIYAAEDVIESYIVDNIHLAAASTAQVDDDVLESYGVDSIQLAAAATHHEEEQIRCFNFCQGLRKVKERMGGLIKKVAAAATHHDDEQIRYINFYEGLQKGIEAMGLIKKEAMKMEMELFREKGGLLEAELQRNVPVDAGLPSSSTERKSEMVGFDDVRLQLLDKLTGGDSKLRIIPIVGMGGIGKTTLARNVIDDKLIKEHFDICVWATISLDHDIERTLREVQSQSKGKDHLSGKKKSVAELGEELHKYLFGRRYLVVLDDMWSIEVWDKIGNFFPDCSQRSRIIVTTRILTLADLLTNSGNSLCLSFLNEDDSWTLFSNTVFGIEGSDPEFLREIGEKIVRKCRGLPLSIAVIGGLLAKSERTQGYWEYIEKNLSSIVNSEDDEYCLRVLKLSYNHLPVYLKPCFLYMGVFDEDCKISVSMVLKLWIFEGFLKTEKNKSLRTIAKECLQELVDRNLIILVRELGKWGYIKYLKIHDLLRDLSLKEAEKQNIYYVLRQRSPHPMYSQRRIVIPGNTSEEKVRDALKSPMPRARSYLSHDRKVHRLPPIESRLLRTLYAFDLDKFVDRCYSLEQVFRFVNSRHLVIGVRKKDSKIIPSCIKMLWNLRTLIVYTRFHLTAPVEVWKMHQLEHVEFRTILLGLGGLYLPHPPPPNVDDDMVIMKNLHTLKGVINFDLNEDTVKRIPNIKKLHITYRTDRVNCLRHLGCLRQLENLRITWRGHVYMQGIKFPESLNKLALISMFEPHIKLGDMLLQEIGSLPLLQKLELRRVVFRSPTWETVEGQFPSLRSLKLHTCDGLKKWSVSDSIPLLRELSLFCVRELEEIPSEIGECVELRYIWLERCSKLVMESAKKILEEEEEMNGEQSNFHVRVKCMNTNEAEAMQHLASPNFHIESLFYGSFTID